ncbi:MAG: FAD-dependent oxidoreductase [Acidiphilium sp. 37-64-53]|nr:MAG: FAD-dependent oxidoreductase [Acidiphilium sp. 37-64-53]OZB28900.1 MAG: FAD-dependent oxidoreductase [Acidiphilium sp. 34-64-41]
MDFDKGGLWRNWVGNQSCIPRYRAAPASETELAELVAKASASALNVRCAGSGHSFTPVALTTGLMLTLSGMAGIRSIDSARLRVTVGAGTRIGAIGEALKGAGLSLVNQGDIDTQAVAGALCTGTHGTGAGLSNMASQIVGMRLVQPDGSILTIDETEPDQLNAARVALGTLGVISELSLQAMPAYNLHERLWRDDFETCMARYDELAANYRHFSFFWCPVSESRHLYCLPDTSAVSSTDKSADVCEMKTMAITEGSPMQNGFERIAYSSEIYPIEYVPNFHELEYAVPAAHGKEALREVRHLMLTKHTNCIYPIEFRFTAGDSGWMSPFYEQDSVTISVSGGPGIDYWSYLHDVDIILRRYNSRPHWGKIHFLDTDDVTALYPKGEQFRRLRRQLDPNGTFLNDHLRTLFE